MNKLILAGMVASLTIAGVAQADDGLALAKKSNCTMCHNVDNKVMGPSFKEVAAKYAGQADAQAKLEAKVRSGGSGSFSGKMPATAAKVSDADIKAMVSWILALK